MGAAQITRTLERTPHTQKPPSAATTTPVVLINIAPTHHVTNTIRRNTVPATTRAKMQAIPDRPGALLRAPV